MLLAISPRLFSEYPSRSFFSLDSLISIGCGRGSRQLSPFIPEKLGEDRTVINE
jgi:hypothetical protein